MAKQAPITNSATIQAGAPVIYQEAMGIAGVTLPPDPIQQEPTYDGALAAFEQLHPIRILFDNGAGGSTGRASRTRASSSRSRASRSRARRAARWFFGPAARSATSAPAAPGADTFTWNATPGR